MAKGLGRVCGVGRVGRDPVAGGGHDALGRAMAVWMESDGIAIGEQVIVGDCDIAARDGLV
jgi:hypothetical protein